MIKKTCMRENQGSSHCPDHRVVNYLHTKNGVCLPFKRQSKKTEKQTLKYGKPSKRNGEHG